MEERLAKLEGGVGELSKRVEEGLASVNKRIDDLRNDMNHRFNDLRDYMNGGFAELSRRIDDLKWFFLHHLGRDLGAPHSHAKPLDPLTPMGMHASHMRSLMQKSRARPFASTTPRLSSGPHPS